MVTRSGILFSVSSVLIPLGCALAQDLTIVRPGGVQVGTSSQLILAGANLDAATSVHLNLPQAEFSFDGSNCSVSVAPEARPGFYELQVSGLRRLSGIVPFFVTNHPVISAGDKGGDSPLQLPMNCVASGSIAKGELDQFQFEGEQGDRVILEVWANRMESPLRAVLELLAPDGRRLAVNRGYFGLDPVLVETLPTDGVYTVQLHDLVFAGGDNYVYRLDVTTGPRVVFAVPPVVPRNQDSTVTLFGWNLPDPAAKHASAKSSEDTYAFESTTVSVHPKESTWSPLRHIPGDVAVESYPIYYPGADVPLSLGVVDLPVTPGPEHSNASAPQAINIPAEIASQLDTPEESHWYALNVRRGEVVHLEGFGQRIGSPVDLELQILAEEGGEVRELARFLDQPRNVGGSRFPTMHLDPEGRWIAPRDGRFLVRVASAVSAYANDARRVYRLSIRREECDMQVAVVSNNGVTIPRGGRLQLDLFAFRRRGHTSSIQVTPVDLPSGVSCSEVWLGPGVTQAPLVLTADKEASSSVGELKLVAKTERADSTVAVQHGLQGQPIPSPNSGRLISRTLVKAGDTAPLRILADAHESIKHHLYGALKVKHAPGSVLDVAIHVERQDPAHQAAVTLRGVGLPPRIENQTSTIPAGEDKGYLSFYLPPSLEPGWYSLAVEAVTTVPGAKDPTSVTSVSNVVSFQVHPPGFQLDLALSVPRKIRRGEIVQVNYTTRRLNGFIGKIHAELAAPGRVTEVGDLRGRGVTFVGQTESGTIQVIANEDAEPGRLPFLRVYAVGVVEDEPVYHGSRFLDLEIVE